MFTYERSGTAQYDTNGGLARCAYHLLRDGYKDDQPRERRLFIIVEQADQRGGKFAPSIKNNWEQIVARICEREGFPNYLLPGAQSFAGARSVHWYEWWPVEIHGPPIGYDLIRVECTNDGGLIWEHMAAHIHDAMLEVLARALGSAREVKFVL